jgi:glycerophosphoryl diester phosphodiesterase
VRRRVSVETFWITSFLPESLARIRDADAAVRLGLLVENVSGARALDCFKRVRVDFLAPDHTLIDEPMLDEARRHQIALLPWVVNDADRIARYLDEPSMFGVITDRPAVAIDVRARTLPANS